MEKEIIELIKAAELEAYTGLYSVLGYHSTSGAGGNLFISLAQNAFAEKAMLCWTYLFGSKTDQYNKHYQIDVRHVFSDSSMKEVNPIFEPAAVYNRIVSETGLADEQYNEYKSNMKRVRDGYLAHKDMKTDPNMPDLNIALAMFKSIREEMWAFVKEAFLMYPDSKELKSLCDHYEWNANHMLENKFRKDLNASGIRTQTKHADKAE